MRNFDSIDILFIILISCYLVTFVGILVLLVLKYKGYKKSGKVNIAADNLEHIEKILSTPIKTKNEVVAKEKQDVVESKTSSAKKSGAKKVNNTKKASISPKKKTTSKSSTQKKKATTKTTSTAKKKTTSTTKRKTVNKKSTQK